MSPNSITFHGANCNCLPHFMLLSQKAESCNVGAYYISAAFINIFTDFALLLSKCLGFYTLMSSHFLYIALYCIYPQNTAEKKPKCCGNVMRKNENDINVISENL